MTFDRRSTGYKPQPKQAENHTQQAQAATEKVATKPARRTVNTSAQPIQ